MVPTEVSGLELEDGGDQFSIRFDARNRTDELDFRWHGSVEGAPDGTISAVMDGVAERDFAYNRIGLCVLHGPGAAGRPYRARTPDGPIEGELPLLCGRRLLREDGRILGLFPPFDELELDLADGAGARFAFEGDLFEMEDQRNWTDASFKTYSTPLVLGIPHHLSAGDRIRQRVVATFRPPRRRHPPVARPPRLVVGAEVGSTLPALGLAAGRPLAPREAELLRALRPDHLRVDARRLAEGAADARALGAPLELAVFLPAGEVRPDVEAARAIVLHEDGTTSDGRSVERARGLVEAPVFACGTDANFADLNRDRPDVEGVDAVAYSISPQVHAFDEVSIVEAAAAGADTVRSAHAYFPGKAVAVGPVTLLPRSTGEVDPRHRSPFAAAWTVASLKYLAESGAASVTYYETAGPGGLVDGDEVFPVYHVFAELAGRKGAAVVAVESSAPLEVDALGLAGADGIRLLVACLVPERREVLVDGRELALGPYEVAALTVTR
jgi:hypothetical protein